MTRLTDPEKRNRQQKELVRNRGGSLMRKAEQLGRLGEIFVFTVFYDPLYGYDGIVNIPEGFEEPNIKKMVCAQDHKRIQMLRKHRLSTAIVRNAT
ncbi:uncharacterized protein PpBr36_11133 [Pyricularia pennisetigena]|uniref:uncharacterized protein n=1 Tax=Pyricularia pennisetigena TaxID=1578925 RepID=UPI0011531FAF|nr:uncharacterized protein PpBr36_11133 [Pyricularia pennisetigena]TLS20512.1 hypothetical protein PpBr36_11133 [Pyricularia pennisetigena]